MPAICRALVRLTVCLAGLAFVSGQSGLLAGDSRDAVARLQESFDASPGVRNKIYTEVIKLNGESMGADSLGRLARAVALFQRAMDGEDEFVDRMISEAPSFRQLSRSDPPFLDDYRAAAAELSRLEKLFPFTAGYSAAAGTVADNWHDGGEMLRAGTAYGRTYPVSRFTRRILLLAGCRFLLDQDYQAAADCFHALWEESGTSSQARDACRLVEAMNGAGGLKLGPERMLEWARAQGLTGHSDLTALIKRHSGSSQAEQAYLQIFENVNRGFSARQLSRNRRNAELLERYFKQFAARFPDSPEMERALLLRSEFNFRCGKKCQAIARKNDYSWRMYKNKSRRSTARKYQGFADTYFGRVATVDSICAAAYPGTAARMQAGLLRALSLIERDRYSRALSILAGLLGENPDDEQKVELAGYAGLIHYHEGHYAAAVETLAGLEEVRLSRFEGWQRAMLFLAKSRDALGDREMAARAYATLARVYPYTYYGIRARLLKHAILRDNTGVLPWVSLLPMVQLPVFPDTLNATGKMVQEQAGWWSELGFYAEAAYCYSHGLSLAPDDLLLRFRYHENFLDAGMYHRVLRGFRGPFHRFLQQGGLMLPENFWRIAFLNPEENIGIIRHEGERRNIPPGLITAVMRQESNFNPGAKSHAGAVGLMQLLPSVGRRLARGEGIGSVSTRRLYDPAVNIRLGTKFLSMNLERYDGNIALAISSYNADPRNLPAWLERSHPAGTGEDAFDLDLFIELIPLEETHYYNRIVLTNYWRYQELGGEHQDLFAWKLFQFDGVSSNK
ncbi:MAG: lytic transglycosylase domain-containing protein [Candidatus Glassbacteria bacterium]|nr:lytic transglycosylase domain-containing protein [Candidatus Glassbacteria bacterium]